MPTFKIFMASNHKLVIKGMDHGIWCRIKLVPFTTTIADDRRDKYLEQKLLSEKSGILNWLIKGALRWRREGLNTPAIVLNATDEYCGEMDLSVILFGNGVYNRRGRQFGQGSCLECISSGAKKTTSLQPASGCSG